jgi:hypothetical protein
LTAAQKELLLWHARLAHIGLERVQSLMKALAGPKISFAPSVKDNQPKRKSSANAKDVHPNKSSPSPHTTDPALYPDLLCLPISRDLAEPFIIPKSQASRDFNMYTPNLRSLLPSQTEKPTSRHAAQKQHQRARSEFVLRRPQAWPSNLL